MDDAEGAAEVGPSLSKQVTPALYLNLGTEMMYILNQRLRVEKDDKDNEIKGVDRDREKCDKILKQIILGFLAKPALDEVFRGLGKATRPGLRKWFEKVAHCSLMRMEPNSMDKLFDLMVMGYKYALQKITMPKQILTVTVNHLRELLNIVPLDKEIGAAVEHAYTMAYLFYSPLNDANWYLIRNYLLRFFQDTRVKVSIFVRDNEQTSTGTFVTFKTDTPVQLMLKGEPVGLAKYFAPGGQITHTSEFPAPYTYYPFEDFPDTLDAQKRSTDLGANKYETSGSVKVVGGGLGKEKMKEGNDMAFFENLMSATVTSNVDESQIWGMSLFDDEQEEKNYLKESGESQNVTRIDASKKKKSLKTAMDDMKVSKRPPTAAAGEKKKKTKGASVLDLMDEAAARPATAKPKAKRSESTGVTTTKPRTRSGSRPTTNASERASSAAPKRAASAKRRTAA